MPAYNRIDRISEENTEHVLDCFRECEVSEALFAPSTGYGYGDRGRDMIDILAAKVFRAPAGFMRPAFMSGTHTIAVALFGILRPGDILLSITGTPYDTLLDVIGIGTAPAGEGSLKDFGVQFEKVEMAQGDYPMDMDGLREAMEKFGDRVKVVYVQRSKGYAGRPTLTSSEIRRAAYFTEKFACEVIYYLFSLFCVFRCKTVYIRYGICCYRLDFSVRA